MIIDKNYYYIDIMTSHSIISLKELRTYNENKETYEKFDTIESVLHCTIYDGHCG